MADDFGSGLNTTLDSSAPAIDNSGALPTKMPAPPPSSDSTFGSALSNMLPGAHYAPPDPGSSALDQSASLLQQRIDRASQVAANPLAQLFAPEQVQAARDFVPQATEQLRTIKSQKQQQVDIQRSATNFGIPQSAQNPFMTNDTIDNWLLDQYKAGDFSKANMLKARGRGDWVQDFAGQAVDGAGAKLTAANGVITKLNAAGSNQPAYAATLRSLSPAERQSLTSLGLQTIPPMASDWQGVVQQHGAAFMQAQQLHSQVSQKLNNITNFDGVVPPDVEKASQGDIRIGSTNEPAGFPVRTRSIDGQTGNVGPNGAVQTEKYGLAPKNGGWSVSTPDRLKKSDDMLATEDTKGAVNQYNIANKFKNEAMNVGMYSSSAGLALLKDTLGGVGRDVAEKSAAAGTTGLSQMFANQQGGFEGFLNTATNNIAAYKNWVDGGRKGDAPRMSDETMRGLQFIAQENYNYAKQQASGRLSGAMRYAGQIGRPLEDMPLDANLKASVAQYHEEGRVDAINGWRSYPSVVRGNQRIFFPQGANVNGASEPRPPLNTDGSANGGGPLTPVQQAGQSAGASSGSAQRPVPPTGTQPSGSTGQPSPSAPQLDPSLVAAVKGFEGFTPKAQWDYKQRSNGYGTKAQSAGEVIDRPTAEARLTSELGSAQASVDQFAPGLPPGARNALTSLTYNAGPAWMQSGLGQAVKSGDLDKAQKILLTYNEAGGQKEPGLAARRQQEASWFDQDNPASAANLTPKQRESLARRGIETAAPGPTPEEQAGQWAKTGPALAGMAPAALGTVGGVIGTGLGGPPGGAIGGTLGGGAGQVLKDYALGNKQSPAKIAEQAALSGLLGVASEARPLLTAAGQVGGSATIEAGAKAAEGGSGPEIVDAGLKGGAEALGGRLFGHALGMGINKVYSLFTPEAQSAVRAAAKDLHEANQTLATEQPKVPGVGGAAGTDNPKYVAAQNAKDAAEAKIKDMLPNAKPDEVAYAHKVLTEGDVPRGEAVVTARAQSAARETSQGYNQLQQDVQSAAGKQVPKVNQSLPDGPIAQIRTDTNQAAPVEAKFLPDAQNAEMLIKAPAANWGVKWGQLQKAGTELIEKRMAFIANGDEHSAGQMDAIFKGVRNQQVAAAKYVFGPDKAPQVIGRLEQLDKNWATIMTGSGGLNYGKMQSVLQSGNTPQARAMEKAFKSFAGDDPGAMRAFNAMKAGAPADWKMMIPVIAGEAAANVAGIPTLGTVSAAAAAGLGGQRLYRVMRQFMNAKVLGQPVKFKDFFMKDLQQNPVGEAVRGAVQRSAVQGIGASP